MRLRSLPVLLLLAASALPACTPRRAHTPPTTPPTPVGVDAIVVDPAAEPIALEVETELAQRMVLAESSGELMARIRIHGPDSGDTPRPRANIALVVDTSASMEGDAIVQARAAALTLLADLTDGDVLSVVTFGSAPEVLVPATVLDADARKSSREAIEHMKAWGTTDLAGGLQVGLQQVQSRAINGEINRIVLVSDGVPNDDTQLSNLAQQARNVGVPITALGLGLDYHETLLAMVAQTSGGKFHFVEEPAAVATVFRDEVLDIEQVAARNLNLTLTPGPGVTIVEVPGMAAGVSGRNTVIGLPDLAEGDTQQIVVRLAVGEHRDGATVELLDGVVSYVDARTNVGAQQRTFAAAKATADEKAVAQSVALDVAVAAARATTAAATLQIVSMARSGQVQAAQTKLDDTVAHARAISEEMPDAELARLVDDLVELRPNLAGLAPPPPPQPTAQRGKIKAQGKGSGVIAHPYDGMGSLGAPAPASAPPPMSPSGARTVRASHERAYKTLNGG